MEERLLGAIPKKNEYSRGRSRALNGLRSSETTERSSEVSGKISPGKINFSLKLAQWNSRGLCHISKLNIINSVACDIFAVQEAGHPFTNGSGLLYKKTIDQKERKGTERGGGTLTLSDLKISSKNEYSLNKDSNLLRLVLDGVFVIWLGNVYLNKGLSKQVQKLFSQIQTIIPEHERKNLILIGDFNINLNEPTNSKVILLRSLCKQFQLSVNEPKEGTRGSSKLDYLICGSGIEATFFDQCSTNSDHDIIRWNIKFRATMKPKRIFIPNQKLAKEITELSIRDESVANAIDLLKVFLWRRKLKRKRAFIKLKPQRIDNDIYKNLLLSVQEEESITETIRMYWEGFWMNIESERYSQLSKKAFDILRSLCKYHLFEKRDGSVVNQIRLDDGRIITDSKQISSLLISVLNDIQNSEEFHQYAGNLPFPDLPQLDPSEIKLLLSKLSTGKAVSFDLFSDLVLRDEELLIRLSELLKDLWSGKLNDLDSLGEIFKARLVALNKAHPRVPNKEEFRPIIILSLIVKIMEARWLPKLQEYAIKKLCPSQTGFVTGQGVFTNVFRVIERIKERTEIKKNVFALFVDFKSAYNHTRHDLLFQRLQNVLNHQEIAFQRSIYDKLIIQSDVSHCRPNLGVAQGSVISPFLFDIYTEPLFWELNKVISLQDIFGYADDILVLCEDIGTLNSCIKIIEDWSKANNLKINKGKSAVLEFVHRKKKKTQLTVGETVQDYPIVEKYKYLGTWLQQKLDMKIHMQQIEKKSNFIRLKLSPFLYSSSLEMKKNLWQIFIVPLFEFLLPLYFHEKAITKKKKAEIILRNSFRSFTGLKKIVDKGIIQDLMGYDLEIRSKYLQYTSCQKWKHRLLGKLYSPDLDPNEFAKSRCCTNVCKDMPKLMTKYINMQTILCPICKEREIITRCSIAHLASGHKIHIDSISQIIDKSKEIRKQNNKLNRTERHEIMEKLISINIEKIKKLISYDSAKK